MLSLHKHTLSQREKHALQMTSNFNILSHFVFFVISNVTVHLVKLIVFSFCSVLFLYLYGEIVEYICYVLHAIAPILDYRAQGSGADPGSWQSACR